MDWASVGEKWIGSRSESRFRATFGISHDEAQLIYSLVPDRLIPSQRFLAAFNFLKEYPEYEVGCQMWDVSPRTYRTYLFDDLRIIGDCLADAEVRICDCLI